MTGQANSKRGTWKAIKRPTDKKPELLGAGRGMSVDDLEARLARRREKGGGSDG